MPDLERILVLYRCLYHADLHGALPGEANAASRMSRERVAETFVSPKERHWFKNAPCHQRDARLRVGLRRFRSWEHANPDIVALLKRKATRQVLS